MEHDISRNSRLSIELVGPLFASIAGCEQNLVRCEQETNLVAYDTFCIRRDFSYNTGLTGPLPASIGNLVQLTTL
jgi:hypothetical protein